MSAPPRPPNQRGGPPPTTIPPRLAERESLLKRAHQVARAHLGADDSDSKPHSSSWKDFFDEKCSVYTRGCTFNVYVAGPRKATTEGQTPVVFCLHGGGYSGLSFALVAEELREEYVTSFFH
jgi:hypothetical protein